MRNFASWKDFFRSTLFFDLSFLYVTLYLLISVCAQFHQQILIVLWYELISNEHKSVEITYGGEEVGYNPESKNEE